MEKRQAGLHPRGMARVLGAARSCLTRRLHFCKFSEPIDRVTLRDTDSLDSKSLRKMGLVAQAHHISYRGLRQEDHNFIACLGYREISMAAWAMFYLLI